MSSDRTEAVGNAISTRWEKRAASSAGFDDVPTLGATALAGVSIGALALSPGLAVAMVCAAVAGVAMVICGVGTQTLLQMAVAGDVRGRVLSLYGIIFRSGPAAGAFVMGLASEFAGLRWPLAVGAGITLLVWVWLWRRRVAIAAALEVDQSSP